MMEKVQTGEKEIIHMNGQMEIIASAISAAIATVNDLNTSVKGIVNFLDVIRSISSQTNLLALNASIESARAGEAGRGFAVVAEEIRKLAEQSANSVEDINKIVSSINEKSDEAISKVGDGNSAASQGTIIIDNVATQYKDIIRSFASSDASLKTMLEKITHINSASALINSQISNIASISQEQAAASEEILASVESQNSYVQMLTESIGEVNKLNQKLTSLL